MVMRNRHEGSGTPNWWDDLPPQVRNRFSATTTEEPAAADRTPPATNPSPPPWRGELLLDLMRFALLFSLIVLVILLYMLVALSYIYGWQPAR